MNGCTLSCMSILVHNEDDRSSVGVGNVTSCNNMTLFHHMVINTLNLDKTICRFDKTTIFSCNTTICTMAKECSSVIRVSRCRDMVGTSCHRSIGCVSHRREICHVDSVNDTFNDDVTRVQCSIGLLCRVLDLINVEFLLISHHMLYITRRKR